MQRLFKRTTPIILSGLLALCGAAACGDDDGGDNADDADDTDDGDDTDDDGGDEPDAGEPDAAGPVLSRAGTIAITETNVTNSPGGKVPPISGGVVSITFTDLATATVAPVEGFTNPVGACQIFVYDIKAGQAEGTLVDEGPISITGTANGDFTCTFGTTPIPGYACRSDDPVSAGGVAGNAEGAEFNGGIQTSNFLVQKANFNAAAVAGSQLFLSGFAAPLDNTPLPVVAQTSMGNLLLAAPASGLTATGPAGATYTTLIGAGPIPNIMGYNFLGETSEISISKGATELVPSIDVTVTAAGEGFTLVDDPKNGNYLPHQIPTNAPVEVNFTCAGDDCGADGAGAVAAFVINGETTDGPLPSAEDDPFGTNMPIPENSYATFTCGFVGVDTATIDADAMEVILGTSPTRIQTTVLRSQTVLEATPTGGTAQTRVVVAHSQTGFTTTGAGIASIARAKAARAKK